MKKEIKEKWILIKNKCCCCGGIVKAKYKTGDGTGKAFAETCDVCANCNKADCLVLSGTKCNFTGKKQYQLLTPPYRMKKHKCPKCGKKMKNIKDKITGKTSKYLFSCGCSPNKVLSKG